MGAPQATQLRSCGLQPLSSQTERARGTRPPCGLLLRVPSGFKLPAHHILPTPIASPPARRLLEPYLPPPPPGAACAMAPPGFLQDPPALGNQLMEDAFLVSLLHRLVPVDALGEALPDLGEVVCGDWGGTR